MSDFERLIAVTNRNLVVGDYLTQIEKVCTLHPAALILREKALSEQEYESLAVRVLEICNAYHVPCFIHSHVEITRALHCENIHFSLPSLREQQGLHDFRRVSVSCHSVEDVLEAQSLGATQALLGNIYETDCKKGLPGKGLALLREACEAVEIPIYAIGGVDLERLPEILQTGAAGGCMMSGFMRI